MSSLNKVSLIGRLGNDPQTTQSNDGNTITRISVATSENWKDKNTGEKRENTEWHRVVFFGSLANVASQYLKKGSQVYVEGKLKTSKYTDKEGIERYSTDVVCSGFDSKMVMLGSAQAGGNYDDSNDSYSAPNNPINNQEQRVKKEIPSEMKVDISDDLPF